jgi:hypothetical protein
LHLQLAPENKKTLATLLMLEFELGAWDGIEPLTRGFSIAVFVKYSCFWKLLAL